VDLLPTSLSLMGVPHLNTTLGRDLLAARPADEHFALIPEGVLTDEFYLQLGPAGQERLYRHRSDAPTAEVQAASPQTAARLRRLHEAYYQTARYLLYHNPPRPHVAGAQGAAAR
jgi:hypothetical protein